MPDVIKIVKSATPSVRLVSSVPTLAVYHTGVLAGGGGAGVTDHGALTGLGDDDHTQYALADGTRGDFAPPHAHPYAATVHSHSNPMLIAYLGSDVVNNNVTANTMADVTGLSFAVLSGVTYKFRFVIRYDAAATTTGSRWSINGPAATTIAYTSEYSLTASTRTANGWHNAYDLPAASNATSATTLNVALITGIVTPSANGTIIARFASEVTSSAITAKAGSYVEYEVI